MDAFPTLHQARPVGLGLVQQLLPLHELILLLSLHAVVSAHFGLPLAAAGLYLRQLLIAATMLLAVSG